MKVKLIACILGLSIMLSSGIPVLAEADTASAGSAAPGTEVQPQQPETAVVPAPVESGTDTGTTPAADPAPTEPGSDAGTTPAADPAVTGGSGASQDPVPSDPVQSGSTPSDGSGETGLSGGSSATVVPEGGSSAESSEKVPAAETAEDHANAETSVSNSKSISADESNTSEEKDKEKEETDEDDPDKKEVQVTGFSGLAEIVVKKKPTLKDAMAMLPTVVEAVLSDGNKIYVPVDWTCTSDYNDEKAERFTFASALKKNPDGTFYNIGHPIAPGVKFPTVNLVIKKEEEDKNPRKESKDPVVEDKPLVMDDVTAANLSPDEGEEQVLLYLLNDLGLNRAAACGVLANIHYESGFNSHAIGDGGTSYGICQWHAGRYLSLVSFCDKVKLPYGSVEGQLKYMEQELRNSYPHVLEYLKKVPETDIGAYDAAYYWCYHFERPAMILRQSTLRGNAAKNSYWPRYKDADPEILEMRERADTALEKNLVVVKAQLDEVDEAKKLLLDQIDQAFSEPAENTTEEKKTALELTERTSEEKKAASELTERTSEEKKADPESTERISEEKKTASAPTDRASNEEKTITEERKTASQGKTAKAEDESESQIFIELQNLSAKQKTPENGNDHPMFAY